MDGKTSFPSTSLPCGEQQIVQNSSFTRFFIIKRTDSLYEGSFKKTSPFLIAKTFQSFLGDGHSLKKLQSGDLLVEISSATQSQLLSNCSTIGTFSVSVETHKTLNTSRGVISEPDLLFSSKDELLENLKDQNVTDARRITIRRNGQILPTKHVILTFNSPTLPTRIKAAYLNCPVRPYIPNPLRCFKCQRYGHTNTTCRGSVTCPRCAEVGHDGKSCENSERCINCKGDHPAYSRSCPNWIREKEILAVKIAQKISYPEARKLVESRTPSVGVSYSSILKQQSKPVRHISTQTDFSIPLNKSTTSQSTSTPIKATRDVGFGPGFYGSPLLERWQPSSEPVTIIYPPNQTQKSSVQSKQLTKHQSNTDSSAKSLQKSVSSRNEITNQSQNTSSQLKKSTNSVSHASNFQKTNTSQTVKLSQKTCLQKDKKTIRGSSQWQTVKKKGRKSYHGPSNNNLKDPRQMQNYVEEAMEESYDSSSDDGNTVFEECVPK